MEHIHKIMRHLKLLLLLLSSIIHAQQIGISLWNNVSPMAPLTFNLSTLNFGVQTQSESAVRTNLIDTTRNGDMEDVAEDWSGGTLTTARFYQGSQSIYKVGIDAESAFDLPHSYITDNSTETVYIEFYYYSTGNPFTWGVLPYMYNVNESLSYGTASHVTEAWTKVTHQVNPGISATKNDAAGLEHSLASTDTIYIDKVRIYTLTSGQAYATEEVIVTNSNSNPVTIDSVRFSSNIDFSKTYPADAAEIAGSDTMHITVRFLLTNTGGQKSAICTVYTDIGDFTFNVGGTIATPAEETETVPLRILYTELRAADTTETNLAWLRGDFKNEGFNTLILQVDYAFDFLTYPHLRASGYVGRPFITKLKNACDSAGINLIPHFTSLGHQGDGVDLYPLLDYYPESFDANPDGTGSPSDVRSWNPLNDSVVTITDSLMREIVDAFGANSFSIGMDEVFMMPTTGSAYYNSQNWASMFYREQRRIVDSLRTMGVDTVYMWGDRLLKNSVWSLGAYESNANEAAGEDMTLALDSLSRDSLIILDWHYNASPATPEYFADNSFKVASVYWNVAQPGIDHLARYINYSGSAAQNMLGIAAVNWRGLDATRLAYYKLAGYTEDTKVFVDVAKIVMSQWRDDDTPVYHAGEQSIASSVYDTIAVDTDDGQVLELGVRFEFTLPGQISKVKIYAGALEGGDHTIRIWNTGTSTVVSGPHTWTITAGTEGWKEYTLPTPLSVSADVEYTLSVSTASDWYYSKTSNYWNAPRTTNNIITYTSSGVYSTTPGDMPASSSVYTTYYRDIVYEANVEEEPPGSGSIYYVSTSGNYNETGTNINYPTTIGRINDHVYQPGDVIKFKRGDVWKDTTLICDDSGEDGNVITYTTYGSGDKPIITSRTGLPNMTWANVNGDLSVNGTAIRDTVWKTTISTATINNLRVWGKIDGVWEELISGNSSSSTDADGIAAYDNYDTTYFVNYAHKFAFEPDDDILYIYTDGNNPLDYYDSLEYCGHLTTLNPVSNATTVKLSADYVDFYDLCFEGGGVSSLLLDNTNNVSFYDCEIGKNARWYGVIPRSSGATKSNTNILFKRTIFDSGFRPPNKRYYQSGGTTQYVTTGLYSGSDDGSYGEDWIIDSCNFRAWHINFVFQDEKSNNITVRYSYFYGYDIDYVKIGQFNGAHHIYFYSNLIDSCSVPLQINPRVDGSSTVCSDLYIVGNTFRHSFDNHTPHDNQNSDMLSGLGNSDSIYVVNNTFLNSYHNPMYTSTWNPKFTFKNNLFVNCNNAGDSFLIIGHAGQANNFTHLNNYYSKSGYSTSTDVIRFIDDATNYSVSELNALNGVDGNVTGNNDADSSPSSLINTTTGRIVTSSPAIGAGVSISDIITAMGITGDFYDYWGNVISTNMGADFNSTP